jgi:hypothetical protein
LLTALPFKITARLAARYLINWRRFDFGVRAPEITARPHHTFSYKATPKRVHLLSASPTARSYFTSRRRIQWFTGHAFEWCSCSHLIKIALFLSCAHTYKRTSEPVLPPAAEFPLCPNENYRSKLQSHAHKWLKYWRLSRHGRE